MGSLHGGHLALVNNCKEHNDIIVTSIFVNPTQFNDSSDLKNYPRSLDQDLNLLEESGCHIVFTPDEDEMYAGQPKVNLEFGELGKIMEGRFRPGHFNGVGLVVAKLLNIVQPDMAFFGEKDLQQLLVIRQLVRDLNFGTEIVGVPTVREKSGLAMSSRNERLNSEQRQQASLIFSVLNECKKTILENASVDKVKRMANELFAQNSEVDLEYLEFLDLDSLEILDELKYTSMLAICAAAYIGEVRLIDNITFKIGK
jgi:pantoate--beta-alanine ligase